MKCASCQQEINTTFMNKLVGTYIKKDSKQVPVCDECQRAYSHEALLERI